MPSSPSISWEAIRDILVETLGVEPDEVTPDASFFDDLGGESIDLLDLGFRCQKAFGINPQFHQLSSSALQMTDEGGLTPQSRAQLIEIYPAFAGRLTDGPFRWQQLFTVGAIHEIVNRAAVSNSPTLVEANR